MNQVGSLGQASGLGYADIIAAILGPVVQGGASAYQTYSESEASADELKQRQKEFSSLTKAEQEKRKAAERAAIVQQQLAAKQQQQMHSLSLQRSAMRGAWWQQNLPLVIGGVVLVSLGVAAIATRKKR
jgi:hypothetical protein